MIHLVRARLARRLYRLPPIIPGFFDETNREGLVDLVAPELTFYLPADPFGEHAAMKYHCLICQQFRPDGNMSCQRLLCSIGQRIEVIQEGEFLNDLVIGRLLKITRTASFYRVKRGKKVLVMKLSHPDYGVIEGVDFNYSSYLKRESEIFQRAQLTHAGIPSLVSAEGDGSVTSNTRYGKVTHNGELRYYVLFEDIEGKFLSDYLDDHPQPYYRHAAWLVMTLAEVFAAVRTVKSDYYHVGLNPDSVIVRFDIDGIPRPVLVDLGVGVLYDRNHHPAEVSLSKAFTQRWSRTNLRDDRLESVAWLSLMVPPEYIPRPVLLNFDDRLVPGAETFNLALLMYQMLVGTLPYGYQGTSDLTIYSAIENIGDLVGGPSVILRPDLEERLSRLVCDALLNDYTTGEQFADSLLPDRLNIGAVPGERVEQAAWRRWLTRERVRMSLFVSLVGLALVVVGVVIDTLVRTAL
ncbi:MAG: hypothetical protein MUF38_05100 [Anaerolineae bacterium]|jgi:hypothetical protein|nr:hypothetical protein [Anaerolineae bacterium]